MLRLALLTARTRPGSFAGALLAFAMSAVLVMAGGMLLEAALRTHPPVERYAAAAAVVAGDQKTGHDHDVDLTERVRVDASLTSRLESVPGVRAAIADVGVPAVLGPRTTEAHNWSSAQLAPYTLTAGRAPRRSDEIVTGYPSKLGARLLLASTGRPRRVTVVGIARPRRPVRSRSVIFLTDTAAARLAGHPGRVDAIGILASRGFDASRLSAAARSALVLTGDSRGKAESPELQAGRTRLIAVAASFAGLGAFVALFVVASLMSLGVQQREQEIGLLRAIAATPTQVRRMIAWEATIVAVLGAAAGIRPGMRLAHVLARGLVKHGIAPRGFAVGDARLAAAGVLAGSVAVALLAVLSASRRAARTAPTRALTEAAVETRLIGPGRLIGGLVAIAAAVPLFAVSAATTTPATAAATSELDAIFLVIAAGCLGPLVAKLAARLFRPLFGAISPVGGFLASANLGAASRRFSSASTPLVLTVAMSCTLLFSTTTLDHAVTAQRHAGLSANLALSSSGPGLPPSTLNAVRSTHGVDSAVALTPTTLGPSLGVSGDPIPAAIVAGGAGGGLDVGVTAGSLAGLHGDTIALGRNRANAAHAHVGERVPVTLGDGTKTNATVVAIYTRTLAFAALRSLASRFPGLRVRTHASLASADEADRETNRWLGPLFVGIIFAFTSIAVVNTLVMIALRRGRELALLRLTGATNRQVRSMARWEAALIVAIGLGVGLAIAATALLPLSHSLTGGLQPYIPLNQLAAILGVSTLVAVIALAVPTRLALRKRPITALASAE
ncbi:MAG: FtsX-like permease family protein [Actinobacteria bacterium]|nr:MAG: FtsX-like permease family protein [Actinomycetota bacterium]